MRRWRVLAAVVAAIGATTFVQVPPAGAASTATIEIDVRPGSEESTFNPNARGNVPVAVKTTSAFDAATVNGATACFGDAENERQRDCTPRSPVGVLEDVDGDGDRDLVLHFQTDETGIDQADSQACLNARTTSGDTVWGCDRLRVIHGAPEPTPPDFVVSVAPAAPTVDPLAAVAWTATVMNEGTGAVTLAPSTTLVRLTVPATLTSPTVTGPAGWSCAMTTATQADCTNSAPDTIDVGTGRAFAVSGVAPATPGPLTLDATADPTGQVAESDEADNTSAGTVLVLSGNLVMALAVSPAVANGGDLVTWTADVRNDGPGAVVLPAGSRLARFDVPPGLAGATASGPAGWACTLAGAAWSCANAAELTIPNGTTLQFSLAGTAPTTPGELRGSATADPDGVAAETDEADNTASAVSVVQAPNLVVSVDATPSAPAPGELVRWTANVRNAGPGSLRLPSGATLVQLQPPSGLAGATVVAPSGYACTADPSGNFDCRTTAADALAAGDARAFVLEGVPSSGTSGLTAVADPGATVHEADEGDNTATASVVVGRPDLSTTVVASTAEADVRDSLTWQIRLKNDGPGAVTIPTGTPVFQIQLPPGLANVFLTSPGGHTCYLAATNLVECAATAPLALGPGEFKEYTLGALAPSEPGTATVTVTVDPTSAINEEDETDNVASTTVVIRRPDLSVTIVPSASLADARDSATWAITITNDGPGAALLPSGTVLFQIQLPPGLANVFLTSPGGHTCYLAATNLVECALTTSLTLEAGQTRSYTLGALLPTAPGAVSVTVEVDPNSDVTEVDEADNSASATITVQAPDLRPTITASTATVSGRDSVTWAITIANDGPGAAFLPNGTVLFQIQLPPGLANVFLTSPGGHTCYLAATNLVECALTATTTLEAGQAKAYTLGALAPSEPGDYTTTITVDPTGATTEADEGDNAASATVTVLAPDLSVTVVDSADPVAPRDSLTWPITITNGGPGGFRLGSGSVLFQIQLPPGLANVFLTSPGGHTCYLAATNLVECATTATLTLAAGQSINYTLGALAPTTPGTITVTVTVDPLDIVSEDDETNNAGSAVTTVA